MVEGIHAGRIDVSDVEALNHAVWPWDLTMRQVSSGRLEAHLQFLGLDGILVNRERWSHRVLATGATPLGHLALAGPCTERAFGWCGDEIDAGHVACAVGQGETQFVTPIRSDHWVLLVPLDRMADRIGEAGLADAAGRAHTLAFDPTVIRQLRAWVETVHGTFRRHEQLLADRRWIDAAVAELLDRVGTLLIGAHPALDVSTPRKRYLACRRALHHVDGLRHPISVPELARVAGVSRRVLERGFQETVGVSPQRFLRWNRLNRLHRELRAAHSHRATVTELALGWGFTELGRMAHEYRDLFGELPSETLAGERFLPTLRLADALPGTPAETP